MQLILYLQCNLFSIAIVLLLLVSMRKNKFTLVNQKIFDTLLISTIIVLVLDSMSWILEGAEFSGARLLYLVIVNMQFLMQFVPCFMWLMYCHITIYAKSNLQEFVLFSIPGASAFILLIANIFTGIVCTVDENCHYQRGSWFHVIALISLFYLVAALIMSLRAYFRESGNHRSQYLYLAMFPAFPTVGVVLQTMYYGLESIWTWVTYALLLIYVTVQNRMAKEKEKEIANANIAIMLSQIQPHFLYNSLAIIKELCYSNPELAGKVTIEFSNYLRGNLDSLIAEKPIHFTKELEHTKTFLYLEKMQYGDNLDIIYDIKSDDFLIPTLTLQPIAENAVKYGMKHKEHVTVRISSYEDDMNFYVVVEDDGLGFDTELPLDKTKSHIGISNVRTRLAVQSQSKLDIKSVPGEGTTAVITVPKERKFV